MIKQQIRQLMQKIVEISFNKAIEIYPNLSSFAIITDEDLRCFEIAINENLFFDDILAGKGSNEEFWNTAEWQSEEFVYTVSELRADLLLLFELLDKVEQQEVGEEFTSPYSQTFSSEYDKFFIDSCYQALCHIRKPTYQAITMFVHVTDFTFHQELFDIVKKLNTKQIGEYYLTYY